MPAAASLWVKLGLTDDSFIKGLKKAENDLKRFGDRLGNLGSRLTVGISLPLALASGACVKFGMDAVESENLFSVSMGKMANAARDWSKGLRKDLGLNEYELRRNIGLYQTMSTAMGLAENSAYDLSKGTTQLAYDMASFFNVANEQTLTDLKAIWTGEAEPLKKYGIVLLDTNVKQWALNNGLIKQGQEMTAAQKVVARYNLVLEQTKNAQGDLARTIESPANKLRILQEQLKMAATEMGIALLPAVTGLMKAITPLVQKISDLANWFANLPAPIQNTIGVLLGVAVAIGPVMLGIGKMISGWSALIGILRFLPTLKVGALFADIGVYIGGAIKGAWSLSTAIGALATSFTPLLIGGVVIAGLIAIVSLFTKMAQEAERARKKVSEFTSAEDIAKESTRLEKLISQYQTDIETFKKALNNPLYNDKAKGEFQTALQDRLRLLNDAQNRLNSLGEQKKKLEGPSESKIVIPEFNAPDYSKFISPDLTGDSSNNAILAPLKTSVAKVGGVLEETVKGMGAGIKKDSEEAGSKITQFSDYLEQTSSIFGNMQGPLKSFAESVVNATNNIQSIQSNISGLQNINTSGPLGITGGVLGAIGNISGFLGAAQGILGMLTGSDQAAEKQQKAAEKWITFLDKASVSELFGAQSGLENKLAKLQKEAKDLQRKADQSGPAGGSFLLKLKSVNKEIAKIKDKLGEDLPQAIAESLGISVNSLSSTLEGAFNAADLTEFNSKFSQSFNEIIRNAMIKNFVSKQALGPLSDAIRKAFDPLSEGGASVTATELANLKAMWGAIGEQGKGFFGVLDQLGLNMSELSKETNKATESMRNVPTGFKVNLNRFSVAEGLSNYIAPITNQSTGNTNQKSLSQTSQPKGDIIIQFTGPVYGMDDFARKVEEISAKYTSKLNTMRFGVSGVR